MAKASSELLERFAKAPNGAKAGMLAGAAVVLGLVYWYFFYSDLQEQSRSQATQAKKLATEQDKLKERKKAYKQLKDKKREIEEGMKTNQISLPASSELPSFFVSLQSQAIAANVQLVKWERVDEIPVETYVKVPVKIEVRGDFYQILEYFKLLNETKRIITIEDLDLGRGTRDGERWVLEGKFTASTFRQADVPPVVIKKDEPKGKGGKDAGKDAKEAAKDDKAGTKLEEKGK